MDVVIAALSAPSQLNGVSRHAINLARALLSVQQITRIHVLTGEWQKQMYESALNDIDARLYTHWVPLADANLNRLSWYYRELPCIAAQLEADIVHLTYPTPVSPKAFHCPTILSLHDLYPFDLPANSGLWKSLIARYIMRQCIQRVDAIACVSASTRVQLVQWFPGQSRKAIVIPNAVELDFSLPTESCVSMLRNRSFILCVAQHRCNKNLSLAIRVFQQLLQEQIIPADSRMVIVGVPGPETKKILRQMTESRLTGKVILLSGLPDSDLSWCYANCAILLAPSSIEGFGLPIAEAALVGCRIVCSDIPAFREIGGECCRFVPQKGDSVSAYAKAIREALALPRPNGAFLPHFGLGNVGRAYFELYKTLACSRIPEFDMLRQPEGEFPRRNPASSRSA